MMETEATTETVVDQTEPETETVETETSDQTEQESEEVKSETESEEESSTETTEETESEDEPELPAKQAKSISGYSPDLVKSYATPFGTTPEDVQMFVRF